jgi:hypothetical protein
VNKMVKEKMTKKVKEKVNDTVNPTLLALSQDPILKAEFEKSIAYLYWKDEDEFASNPQEYLMAFEVWLLVDRPDINYSVDED